MLQNKQPKLLDSTLISETLQKIGHKKPDSKTKISEILEDFHENGILLAMIFFSLPVAVPLPYPPGFTTIMGLPLIILSIQMLLGSKKVRLPQKINDYEIKNSTLKNISNKIVPIIVYIEKYVRPRFSFARSVYCEQLVGFICLIASLAILIPLPFTNAVPAQGVVIMAIGLLNRDGLIIIAGFVVTLIGLMIAVFAIIAYWLTIKYLFHAIFSYFV